jgi:DNA-binding NtrC family response regulator
MTSAPASSPSGEATSPIRVLIAEDEAHLGTILEQFMTARGFSVRVVRDGRSALELLRTEPFDVALLDVVMPEVDGLEVLRLIRDEPLPPEIIVITGNGTIETALAALKLGAYDFLSKPYRMAEIEALVRRAWEKRLLVRTNHHLRARLERQAPVASFVTQYAPLTAVLSMVGKFAASPMPVFVTGEAGTGKALVARLLHQHGARPAGPFVHLDCAATDPALQVRELVGVDRGNEHTGGHHHGVFELASGGTLYLEQIDALTPSAQALLRDVLDSLSFTRRNGTQRLPFDVRLVVSSGRDMPALVAANVFDEALGHRLTAMRVALPPLRDRAVDIPLLARHVLAMAKPGHRGALRLSDDAVNALEGYRWPGNVRELTLVMERAAILADRGVVEASHLLLPWPTGTEPVGAAQVGARADSGRPPAAPVPTAAPSLGELERQHIAEVLERTGWHQGRAAELLGISPKTLYRKIREYGFKRPSGRNA